MTVPNTGHRIAAVHFERKTNDGPLICTCGDNMPASEFSAHRKTLGLTTWSPTRVPDEERLQPTVWRRSINS